jgi:nucleoside-diphosphate-sugar epimerase
MQLKPIDQQIVVVVGASSSIGRETAIQLAARGAKLVVSARSEPGLNSLVDEQETNEPKPQQAPDNLFEPISGFDRVEGDLSKQSRANSYSTWLETHPMAKWSGICASLSLLSSFQLPPLQHKCLNNSKFSERH